MDVRVKLQLVRLIVNRAGTAGALKPLRSSELPSAGVSHWFSP